MPRRTLFAVNVHANDSPGTGREIAMPMAAPSERIAGQAPKQHGIEGYGDPFSLFPGGSGLSPAHDQNHSASAGPPHSPAARTHKQDTASYDASNCQVLE
ncbi:hypothetical protein D3C76_1622990 [compost metagenome]